MRKIALIILLVLIARPLIAGDAGAKHVIKAYFNGQEATVSNVTLKVGEPFTVDLEVAPDRQTTVLAILREPGGGEDAYSLISGDIKGDIVKKNGGPGDAARFHWVLMPSGTWTDGSAPLNIQYDVWGVNESQDVQGYFTVVDAYISAERYHAPKQAGIPGYCIPAAALAFAARLRLALNTKPINTSRPLLRAHVREVIQTVKSKKVYTGPGLDAQQQAHPVGRHQRD